MLTTNLHTQALTFLHLRVLKAIRKLEKCETFTMQYLINVVQESTTNQ